MYPKVLSRIRRVTSASVNLSLVTLSLPLQSRARDLAGGLRRARGFGQLGKHE